VLARVSAKYPVVSQLAGNLRAETGSLVTASSSGESGELRMARPSSELLAPPRTRDVLRDEVVAERKIVYLRNVGQGSSGAGG